MFEDRMDAGRELSDQLLKLNIKNPVVFGIPRGGVVVAKEISDDLDAPLDIVVTRKLGTPFNPELGLGAIGPKNVAVFNERLLEQLDLTKEEINKVRKEENSELERRIKEYGGMKIQDLKGKIAILADDGIATGYTVLAAVNYLKKLQSEKIIVTAPVCSPDSARMIEESGVQVVCLEEPLNFEAVGQFYRDFPQTTDEEVKSLLKDR